MKVGIGLPNAVPGTSGALLKAWAQRAEARGFTKLGTIDRLAYPSYESLIALTAAAAVTERITLMTNVLLGPTRNPALLAKEAICVDQISGGRLVLGLGVGGRADDFETVGMSFQDRGRRMDAALELFQRVWQGEPLAADSSHPITPDVVQPGGVPLMFGGWVPQSFERVARWGTGWTTAALPPDQIGAMVEQVRQAWQAAGCDGQPEISLLLYYGLGPNAEAGVASYISHYYSFMGDMADAIVQGSPTTAEAVQGTLQVYEAVGVTEAVLFPCIAELEQVDLLADATLS
jgi:alkanesulfonate monooxygenase SsuD/methylene tetrahydromethanopterin reductase-like flavin-dependent oxidoreductase (luciferase family)